MEYLIFIVMGFIHISIIGFLNIMFNIKNEYSMIELLILCVGYISISYKYISRCIAVNGGILEIYYMGYIGFIKIRDWV